MNIRLALLVVVLTTYTITLPLANGQDNLQVGFYSQSCPQAEEIVTSVVRDAIAKDTRNAAILLRLHFHDCFVDGCDGSILLDNGPTSERRASGHAGVQGFELIESAKAQLENTCKQTVSCSDIVALAARDAIFISQGPFYQVPTGRRDGRVSSIDNAVNIPDVDDSIEVLKGKFLEKGLTDEELVLLTAGGHTIGTTGCFFMPKRLYSFTERTASDPSINPSFLSTLKNNCPFGGDANVRIPLDPVTSNTFDHQPFLNLRDGIVVLNSDAKLMDDPSTRRIVQSYLSKPNPGEAFVKDFVQAIVKMGKIGVKIGGDGDTRTFCSSIN